MIPVVITSSAYEKNESACLQRVNEVIQSMPARAMSLLIDDYSLKSITESTATHSVVSCVKISEWLDSAHQPIKVVIRTSAKMLSVDKIMLLDARHHDAQVIERVLYEVAQVWFHIKTWQPAFILIVDDYLAAQFARKLSELFFVKTQLTSRRVIQSEMRHLRRLVFSRRWLGIGSASRLAGALNHFSGKLKRYVHRKLS